MWAVLKPCRAALIGAGALTIVIGLMPFAGALYLLLTLDTVLASHSAATLGGLFVMAVVGLGLLTILAVLRGRIVAQAVDLAASLLTRRIDAQLAGATSLPEDAAAVRGGLDACVDLAGRPGVIAALPLIVFPLFVGALALLHGWFALLVVVAAATMVGILYPAWRAGPAAAAQAAEAVRSSNALRALSGRHAELITVLGMGPQTEAARQMAQAVAGRRMSHAHAPAGDRLELVRALRMLAIVLALTIGGWLVIDGAASIGVMMAATLLVAEALAPIVAVAGELPAIAHARAGWARIGELLDGGEAADEPLPLPVATERLDVEGLTLTVPEARRIITRDISFSLKAGDALALVGPSASGKTALLRGLIGGWLAASGKVRLDGAALDQWTAADLGRQIGYLPQEAMLFEGTVAQNIARFDPSASSDAVIAAATAGGVHDLIVRLPQGYATEVGADGRLLSAGERQRIALARALFGDPFLLVLDDPTAHLDAAAQPLLAATIRDARARGAIVISTGNAQAVIETASMLAVLRNGRLEDFGPRDDVRERLLKGPARPTRHDAAAPAPVKG